MTSDSRSSSSRLTGRSDDVLRVGRRAFVAGTVATALAGASRPASAARSESVDVAIVGAGLAGMNAAMILSELGAKVVVLEADARPGGRCLTMDRWHLAPDLGGAQIGREYARTLDVARRLGIALGPGAHVNAPYSFVVGDKLIPAKDWSGSALNRLVGAERDIPPHALGGYYVERRTPFKSLDGWLSQDYEGLDISLADWLTRQGASPEARRIIQHSQGRPLEKLSVLRMMQEATRAILNAASESEELKGKDAYERAAILSRHVVGGTSRLTDAMARSLGERVRLRKPVQSIETGKRGCVLRCADGTSVRARFALAATTFTALRQIRIAPALQGVQAEAVQQMTYGNQSQVWLRTKRPYWELDGIEASMWTDGAFNLIRQQIENDGHRELISVLAFTENSKRLDAMPEAERGRFAIAEIERMRPSTKGLLEFVGAHSWERSPWIRGCSYQMAPGRARAWAADMAKPHHGLHFAGEHLRRLEVGMEAAMESGERAAGEIAQRLST